MLCPMTMATKFLPLALATAKDANAGVRKTLAGVLPELIAVSEMRWGSRG